MINFDLKKEEQLLDFMQRHYGLELFIPGVTTLERTDELYQPLIAEFKKHNTKVIIIAGTNGKGQTAHTLAYLLKVSGKNYGLWTSPHILSIRERFSFFTTETDGDISYQQLEAEMISAHQELERKTECPKISFYEFLFFVFLRMSVGKVDYLILEVGLGGRLDAVNHFDADVMGITSISLDHQKILGDRYDLILKEKLAVSRRGKPLFTNFKLAYLNQLTKSYCQAHGVLWRPLNKKLKPDSFYIENEKMAYQLFSFLRSDQPDLIQLEKLEDVRIPFFRGRREEMTIDGNRFIFVGAHNMDGVRRMTELFNSSNCSGSSYPDCLLVSFSMRPPGEIEVMLKTLVDFFGTTKTKIKLTSFIHPKAMKKNDIEYIEKKFNQGPIHFVDDWKKELNTIKNQKILVCGSYYFIGEILRFLHRAFRP